MNVPVIETERLVLRIYCHSVGGSATAARAGADLCRAALHDVTPAVAGRTCWPIRHEDGSPPRRDESAGTAYLDQVDIYRLESIPAS